MCLCVCVLCVSSVMYYMDTWRGEVGGGVGDDLGTMTWGLGDHTWGTQLGTTLGDHIWGPHLGTTLEDQIWGPHIWGPHSGLGGPRLGTKLGEPHLGDHIWGTTLGEQIWGPRSGPHLGTTLGDLGTTQDPTVQFDHYRLILARAGNLARAGKFFRAGRTFCALARKWDFSAQHPWGFGSPPNCPLRITPYTTLSGLPPATSEHTTSLLPWKGGYPQLQGRGYHSFPRSSGDISISHLGVSRGHRNVPHTSHCLSKATLDSSRLRRPPSRTLLLYNGSFIQTHIRRTIQPLNTRLSSL